MAGPRRPNKRAKGEGSIFKITRTSLNADGKKVSREYWCGQVEAGRHPSGKRRFATITRKTKREVIAALPDLKRRVQRGVVGPDSTVGELLDEWLLVRENHISESSLKTYRKRANLWIKPHLGHVRLRKLTTQHIRDWMTALQAQGISARLTNTCKGQPLGSALRWAVNEGKVLDNVAERVEGYDLPPKLDDGLNKEEADKVLAAARDDRLYTLLFISLTLGLRQSEALDLRWSDLDLDVGEFRVDKSKTKAGERTLPLVAGTHDSLKDHRKRMVAEGLEQAGRTLTPDDRVFSRPDGRRIAETSLRTWLRDVCKRAGVEPRRWHALRHSAVELMLDAGVPIELVSVIVGHSGIAITANMYARWSKDTKRRELKKYEKYLVDPQSQVN